MIRSLPAILFLLAAPLAAQSSGNQAVPDLDELINQKESELAPVLSRWQADRGVLSRRYSVDYSSQARERFTEFNRQWLAAIRKLDFGSLSRGAQVDEVLLNNRINYELSLLNREKRLTSELAPLIPFADTLDVMLEERREFVTPDPELSARRIAQMITVLSAARKTINASVSNGTGPSRIVAYRAADAVGSLSRDFANWKRFYLGYDPMMTWRLSEPAEEFEKALTDYRKFLRERVVGAKAGQDEPIVGDPIGRDGLIADLANEMVAYTPEELLKIAEEEFAYLEGEARAAAREMGLGDDWKAALERTKNDYPPVGDQARTVRDMAWEATEFVESRNLITVPPLAKEVWRMEMMSAEAQKTNPFFLGGEVIMVSSPTEDQTEEEKLMALRANNRDFSRATVFHELIPGHHLQGFVNSRNNTYRGMFRTPFYHEGWALWWEIHLWDLGFPVTPENKMGMLFWRMHRAARIIFSINFHLGNWTPEQCIDFLVERVGHERASATGEVRRSFNGNYSPLYQAGYLLGGMQIRALYGELVTTGRMSERDFHDAILKAGPMPIEMIRALLMPEVPLQANHVANWKFAG